MYGILAENAAALDDTPASRLESGINVLGSGLWILILNLAEYFPDLVLDSVRPARFLLESVQIGKELQIDEVAQVIASLGLVVVDRSPDP